MSDLKHRTAEELWDALWATERYIKALEAKRYNGEPITASTLIKLNAQSQRLWWIKFHLYNQCPNLRR